MGEEVHSHISDEKVPLTKYNGVCLNEADTASRSLPLTNLSPAWFAQWSVTSRIRIIFQVFFFTFAVSSIGRYFTCFIYLLILSILILENSRSIILSMFSSY